MKRRDLLAAASAAFVIPASAVLAAPTLASAAILDHQAENMPFLMPLADDPNMVGLCVPATKITHAFRYMLADGRTIYGERGRCNDGSGWRDCLPSEWDGRIVGRIVTLLRWSGKRWSEMGRSELEG